MSARESVRSARPSQAVCEKNGRRAVETRKDNRSPGNWKKTPTLSCVLSFLIPMMRTGMQENLRNLTAGFGA